MVNIARHELARQLLKNDRLRDMTPQDTFFLISRSANETMNARNQRLTTYLEGVCLDKRDDLMMAALSGMKTHGYLFMEDPPDIRPVKVSPAPSETEVSRTILQAQKEAAVGLPSASNAEAYAETLTNLSEQANGELYYTETTQRIKGLNTF